VETCFEPEFANLGVCETSDRFARCALEPVAEIAVFSAGSRAVAVVVPMRRELKLDHGFKPTKRRTWSPSLSP
jgi:hypothetical protein